MKRLMLVALAIMSCSGGESVAVATATPTPLNTTAASTPTPAPTPSPTPAPVATPVATSDPFAMCGSLVGSIAGPLGQTHYSGSSKVIGLGIQGSVATVATSIQKPINVRITDQTIFSDGLRASDLTRGVVIRLTVCANSYDPVPAYRGGNEGSYLASRVGR